MRWTTGVGIALGGTGGAIAALIGVPQEQPTPRPQAAPTSPAAPTPTAAPLPTAPSIEASSVSSASAAPSTDASAASGAPAAPSAEVSALGGPALIPPPMLDIPATRPALLKAMLHCDQRQDFDACARVAVALDSGTTGPADPVQAKRFRKIALTHLVGQCEAASARACMVLAIKYRAGTELAQNLKGAEALEQRAAELCRLHPGPDCPSPEPRP